MKAPAMMPEQLAAQAMTFALELYRRAKELTGDNHTQAIAALSTALTTAIAEAPSPSDALTTIVASLIETEPLLPFLSERGLAASMGSPS